MAFKNVVEHDIKLSALDLIGNTPIVALDRLYTGPGRILAKCELMNPGGSIKCRSSLYMIRKALESKQIAPGTSVIDMTSGNQGCGLAVVCAVLGIPFTAVMSRGNSAQRAIHMEALGAKCIRVPQVEGTYGYVTCKDTQEAKAAALKLAEVTNGYYIKQCDNPSNVMAHYETTGPEIWKQTGGRVDVLVTAVGTAGTFTGTTKFLKEKNSKILSFVVEPKGLEPIGGGPRTKREHLLQGAGRSDIPFSFEFDNLSGTVAVSDEDTLKYQKLIGEKEGLYVGYTSAANVAAAIHLLENGKVAEDSWIVTFLTDSGLKYTPVPEELK